jgi:hypothetical protein
MQATITKPLLLSIKLNNLYQQYLAGKSKTSWQVWPEVPKAMDTLALMSPRDKRPKWRLHKINWLDLHLMLLKLIMYQNYYYLGLWIDTLRIPNCLAPVTSDTRSTTCKFRWVPVQQRNTIISNGVSSVCRRFQIHSSTIGLACNTSQPY